MAPAPEVPSMAKSTRKPSRKPRRAAPAAPADDGLYPYPEVLEDWSWLFDELKAGRLKPYAGHYVAVFEKRILGSGEDVTQLQRTVAADHHLDPDRLVIMYVDKPGWPILEGRPWLESV
jgi:hypothetical protein